MKIKIVADKHIPFLQDVFEPYADIEYFPGKEITNKIVKNADCLIIRTRTKANEELLKGSQIKMIASATIGHDHIDKTYCEQNNIAWTNAEGCNSSSVKQYIASVFAQLYKKSNETFTGKTLGIVGVGNVGKKVAALGEKLGMKVLLNDPPRKRNEDSVDFVSLENILQESDILSIHAPLSKSGQDKTLHLFDRNAFELMSQKPVLINSARGEIVKTDDLKCAIDNELIKLTILDTWENEPNIDLELMNMVFLASPHIAGYSADGKATGTKMVVNAVSRFFDLPLNHWQAVEIPFPFEKEIKVKGENDLDIWANAILQTYDVFNDDKKLRDFPQNFEKFREDYPIRREPTAFLIKGKEKFSPFLIDLLEETGFQVL